MDQNPDCDTEDECNSSSTEGPDSFLSLTPSPEPVSDCDATNIEEPVEETADLTISVHISRSQIVKDGDLIRFALIVRQAGRLKRESTVYRSYSDFERLRDTLMTNSTETTSDLIPIPLPSYGLHASRITKRRGNFQRIDRSQRDDFIAIVRQLQLFLGILLSHPVYGASQELEDFLELPEGCHPSTETEPHTVMCAQTDERREEIIAFESEWNYEYREKLCRLKTSMEKVVEIRCSVANKLEELIDLVRKPVSPIELEPDNGPIFKFINIRKAVASLLSINLHTLSIRTEHALSSNSHLGTFVSFWISFLDAERTTIDRLTNHCRNENGRSYSLGRSLTERLSLHVQQFKRQDPTDQEMSVYGRNLYGQIASEIERLQSLRQQQLTEVLTRIDRTDREIHISAKVMFENRLAKKTKTKTCDK